MRVAALMTKNVHTCAPYDTLDKVARIMWEHDIGAVPVVNEEGRTTGMITDRDLSMAAYTQGKPLSEIPVWVAASNGLIAARPEDTIDTVHNRMRAGRVRRLPVVDKKGEPIGIVSIADLARHYSGIRRTDGVSADSIAVTLSAIVEPRSAPIEDPLYRVRPEDGSWDVYDRADQRVGRGLRTQSDAVIHAKELARRDGSAQIIVYDEDGNVVSEFFHQAEERSALSSDDRIPTWAATRPAHHHTG